MTITMISSDGFIGGSDFSGITGAKIPILPMLIRLEIDNPPPPLTLLINPSSFDLTFASKVTKTKVRKAYRGDFGYSFEHHHDELDEISMSCDTALNYDFNRGLTDNNVNQVMAYDHTQKLLAIYRNNGKNYNTKQDSIIESIGRVVIQFDGVHYYGSFNDFKWTHTADTPFNYSLSWTFTVTETKNFN